MWKIDLPSPKKTHSNAMLAVGNITGDSTPEIVCVRQLDRDSGSSPVTALSAIDASGRVLATGTLKGVRYASAMWITEGKPNGTVLIAGEAIIRYTFDAPK